MAWNRRNKFHAVKITTPDGVFDSKKEYKRWQELLLLQKAGEITDLRRQVEFELIPEHRAQDYIGPRGGVHKGRVIEKKCVYKADFVYREVLPFGTIDEFPVVVEDVKGVVDLPVFVIKRKLMYHLYGIQIKVV